MIYWVSKTMRKVRTTNTEALAPDIGLYFFLLPRGHYLLEPSDHMLDFVEELRKVQKAFILF